jgi:glutamate transport system substrate-binding protein
VATARALGVLAFSLAVLAACAPPAPEVFVRHHDPETYMGELQRSGRIRIAIAEDAVPLGYQSRREEVKGFTVALGRMVADALHVRAELRAYPSDRLPGLVGVGGADVAFPLAPTTEEVVRRHDSTDPYLVGHQRLLVGGSSRVEEVAALVGKRVCSFVDADTGVALDELGPSIVVQRADRLAACGEALARGRVAAVTAQDFLLAYLRERLAASGERARLVGDALSTVGYGAIVIDKPGLTQFVNEVFAAAKSDGRWAHAYARWISGPPPPAPTMTVWEAAALWPLDR